MLTLQAMITNKLRSAVVMSSLVAGLLCTRDAQAQNGESPASPDVATTQSLQAVLDEGAKQQADSRKVGGWSALAVGAVFVGAGTGLIVDASQRPSGTTTDQEMGAGLVMGIGGVISLISAPFIFLIPGDIETLSDKTRTLARSGNIIEMERQLDAAAHKAKTFRIGTAVASLAVAAVITPIGVISVVSNSKLDAQSTFNAGGAIGIVDTMLISFAIMQLVRPSLSEELNRAWLSGGRIHVAPAVSPTGMSLTGVVTF
jgi:hypothetical protein